MLSKNSNSELGGGGPKVGSAAGGGAGWGGGGDARPWIHVWLLAEYVILQNMMGKEY